MCILLDISLHFYSRKKLDETTAELKVTSKLLAEEKLKTDNLLFRMLPQKVADDLKNGRVVQAGKTDNNGGIKQAVQLYNCICVLITPDIIRAVFRKSNQGNQDSSGNEKNEIQ